MRLQKEELATVAILLCALVAVGILYVFLSGGAHAQYSASSKDGDSIYAQGTLLSKSQTKTGGHIVMSIRTDAGILNVFVPASCDTFNVANSAKPGKSIKVTGKLQTYNGAKEIVADSISTI
jgi:DNA/RNA endonuclease YhcR with UshA esterase domain